MTLHATIVTPIVIIRFPCLPLDTVMLKLTRAQLDGLMGLSELRAIVGVIAQSESATAEGAHGTLCEFSRCDAVLSDGICAVRAVGFARYRTTRPLEVSSDRHHLILDEVEPLGLRDLEPEDDELLRGRRGDEERRRALSALEIKPHLSFQNVVQMLNWDGGTTAASAKIGTDGRAHLHHAVHRFAPLAVERAQYMAEACELLHEDEACRVGASSDVCMLERAYLLGSAAAVAEGLTRADTGADGTEEGGELGTAAIPSHADSAATVGANDPETPPSVTEEGVPNPETAGGATASGGVSDAMPSLADFACPRHELYSFAVSRLRDLSPAESQAILEGRSTGARLSTSEAHLDAAPTWLSGRLGFDLLTESRPEARGHHDSDSQSSVPQQAGSEPCTQRPWAVRMMRRVMSRRRSSPPKLTAAEPSKPAASPIGSMRYRGRLCFGAARGPRWWNAERDGEWSPGYWVEIEGGRDDGLALLVAKDDVGAGLMAGDKCCVELFDGEHARCMPLGDAAAQQGGIEAAKDARGSGLVAAMRSRPSAMRVAGAQVGSALGIAATAMLLAYFAPQPSLEESLARCAQLISGAIETADQPAAEAWLETCNVPSAEANALLADVWQRRWGTEELPRLIQGVAEP